MNNKKVLISGVNSGIGYATALIFAKEGFSIFGIDLNEEVNPTLSKKVASLNSSINYSKLDVSDYQQVGEYFEKLNLEIDVLVNNAGILGPRVKTADYPKDAFDTILDVNVKGVFHMTKLALPHLKKDAKSSIVNVASVAGLVGMANHIAYSASKHAVVGMTKTLAIEYAKIGIRVNAVCPGFTETNMLENAQLEIEYREGLKYATPMKRFGVAEEIASAIYYLASENASFITGHCLTIDGGLTAQ
ncbi:SDR family oxidoreductase [Lacihabitans sp. LS3-19]|uniref:SDR family NAD(P)-dependent oxidoreductase n=1 Tax=Lacihabitans sp. LS3-19 TaxID=2487335 RepID=UPI0020CE3F88|nr:SDR family oxidoreductase [Lacihabitans sp. LS3-19]MCP9767716.1 SDR family oxidoreductase [Lacihabitans sp. LS3-19]